MTRATRQFLLLAACAAALAAPGIAAAHHNTDSHSANMRLGWTFPETPTRTHSDIAFWGTIGVSGNYDGFRMFDMSRPPAERSLVNFLCRGPQNDVSLWRHNGRLLLFMSIDVPQRDGDTVCSQVRSSDTSVTDPAGFEGIRIFDVTNPATPQYIRAVRTNCGSHTHTLVPDLSANRLLIYSSSASSSTGPYCQNPHNRIPIVEVPLNAPETASVIAEPRLIPGMRGCHDITVYLAINLAAAACETEGQLWDITNRAAPVTLTPLARIDHGGVNYWHSAAFTWDGRYVVFDDESFSNHGCSPTADGRVWIYRVADQALMSSFTTRSMGSGRYCSSHNGNIIPVRDRYLLVMAWYEGGTSVVDFTNPTAPVEVAYYTAVEGRGLADSWSSYWYNGSIYSNDIRRGTDVFQTITPWSPYGLTFDHLNAQTQESDIFFSAAPLGGLLARGPGELTPARAAKPKRTAIARARGSLWRFRVR